MDQNCMLVFASPSRDPRPSSNSSMRLLGTLIDLLDFIPAEKTLYEIRVYDGQ